MFQHGAAVFFLYRMAGLRPLSEAGRFLLCVCGLIYVNILDWTDIYL